MKDIDLYIVVYDGQLLSHQGHNTLHSVQILTELGIIRTEDMSRVQSLHTGPNGKIHLLPIITNSANPRSIVEQQDSWQWKDIRHLLSTHAAHEFQYHAQAVQYFYWLKEHQYCGICGSPTEFADNENALRCAGCNKSWFPRIQPCVITLIHNKDHILLAKHSRYVTNMYSCIAGFAESGENLEQALAREVQEEVGIRVHNIRYFGSQAWPFPYQLMVGFYAEYLDGDIVIDNDEIVDAKWWSINELPEHPPSISIAGQLIEQYVSNPWL